MKRKFEAISEDEVRQKVEEKFENRAGLLQHFAAYAIVNAVLWGLFFFLTGGFPWPVFVTAFWGIGMLAHLADYYYKYGAGARKREAEIEAELLRQARLSRLVEAERQRGLYDENDFEGADVYDLDDVELRHVRLSDDGELADFDRMPERDEAQRGRRV